MKSRRKRKRGPGDPRLGGRIKALRDERGWSQAGLADKLGVTQTAVSYWEDGRIGLQSLRALAGIFGVGLEAMIPPPGARKAAER